MKKNEIKKLTLSRESLRLLNDEKPLREVAGGLADPTVGPGCYAADPTVGPGCF